MERGRNLLFLAAVHGDEGFSIPILQGLERDFPQCFSWVVANEEALRRGIRFTDTDLNRSAPGESASPHYEMRRAAQILETAKGYRFVIDVHGTTAESGIFVIVSNPTPCNIALAAALPIANVVIWASKPPRKFGSLTQFVDCGVGIECGPKNSIVVQEDLRHILTAFLTAGVRPDPIRRQNWFRVCGKIPSGHGLEGVRDFQETFIDDECFYPLLVGQYEDVFCYMMQKIDFHDLLGY
ncbi:MAG: succinylglutamate desuccinylase/aspartoacylase family protein [Patescibacteria group bacterium]